MSPGTPAPDFQGQTADGSTLSLQDFRGRWLVLYFYTKANSPGCSIEAQHFERNLPEFHTLGAAVVGVSTDGMTQQQQFIERCSLSFPLVADTSKAIAKAYGALGGIQGLFGLVNHQTFLIDPNGRVAQHWPMVNPFAHVSDVLDTLKQHRARV
jgi:thioredoxin-dependent peroxiredoxin